MPLSEDVPLTTTSLASANLPLLLPVSLNRGCFFILSESLLTPHEVRVLRLSSAGLQQLREVTDTPCKHFTFITDASNAGTVPSPDSDTKMWSGSFTSSTASHTTEHSKPQLKFWNWKSRKKLETYEINMFSTSLKMAVPRKSSTRGFTPGGTSKKREQNGRNE